MMFTMGADNQKSDSAGCLSRLSGSRPSAGAELVIRLSGHLKKDSRNRLKK
jgi:hypothetical protein